MSAVTLGPELCDEVFHRKASGEAKDTAKAKKKDDGERLVIREGRRVLYERNTTIGFRWTNEKLKAAIKYKRKKDDKRPIPTKKDKLEERWAQVKKNKSAHDKSDEEPDTNDDADDDADDLGEDESEEVADDTDDDD